MRFLPAIFLLILNSFSLQSQTAYEVTGNLQDDSSQPVSYANAVLYQVSDSAVVRMNYSEENGDFTIGTDQAGQYYLEVTYVGLQTYRSQPFDLNESSRSKDFGSIALSVQGETLDQVVVTARKPLLEVHPDKMVVNVAGSINSAGNNALELLRKSPGVMVDQNDNISLLGQSGVRIYINGKKSPLSGDQLANYLKSLPSEDIENIELITQPSARYDAEGNAGIINIVLRKNQSEGYNANVALSYAQGKKARYNGSVNTNYKTGKVNLFGALTYYRNEWPNDQILYREQNGMIIDQDLEQLSLGSGWNFRGGLDYQLSSNSILGVMVNGNTNEWDWNKESRALIRTQGQTVIDSILLSGGGVYSDSRNTNYNLNYKFTGDRDQSLNFDADYGYFSRENDQDQPNTYFDGTEQQILRERNYFIQAPSDIHIFTLRSDYEQPLWEGTFSTGLKWSRVLTDNTFNFFNIIEEVRMPDDERSNDFTYDEQVYAAYGSYNKKIGKWGLQAGLRVEHTYSRGILESRIETGQDDVERNYTDLFPNVGFTYDLNDKNALQLNYSSRINRPNYSSLNPFEFKLDELTFEKGNPFLSPEYTRKVQVGHTWNHIITTSLSYAHTRDLITQLIDIGAGNTAYQTYRNLASQKDFSLNISGTIPITDWWSAYTNANWYYREAERLKNQTENIKLHINSVQVYSQHTFTLPGEFSLELNGYYNSPTIWGGQFISKQQWGVNAGVQKKLFNGQATLKLAVDDLFNSMGWESYSDVEDFYFYTRGNWDSQQVKLSFSYALGNNKIKTRQRSTGLEDEKSRVN